MARRRPGRRVVKRTGTTIDPTARTASKAPNMQNLPRVAAAAVVRFVVVRVRPLGAGVHASGCDYIDGPAKGYATRQDAQTIADLHRGAESVQRSAAAREQKRPPARGKYYVVPLGAHLCAAPPEGRPGAFVPGWIGYCVDETGRVHHCAEKGKQT